MNALTILAEAIQKLSQNLVLVDDEELQDMDLTNADFKELAQRAGVNILSDKEFNCGHVDMDLGGGSIVSAMFTSWQNETYSFDTIVDPRYQNQGLGTELIQIGIDEFQEYQYMDPEAKMELDVVNEGMVPFLERKYGLKVIDQQGGHYIMASNIANLRTACGILYNACHRWLPNISKENNQ